MMIHKLMLSGAALVLGLSAASAGPCDTRASRDAGSGNVPGYTGQTVGKTSTGEHPPTANMNKAVGNTATSSQDTQRQMQGQPTTAQQSENTATKGGQGC